MIVFHHQDSAKSSGDLYLYSSKSGQNPLGLDGEYLLKVSTDFERELSMGKQNLFKSVLRLVGYGRFWGDDGRERAFLVFPLKKKGDLQRNIKGIFHSVSIIFNQIGLPDARVHHQTIVAGS